MLPDQLLPRGHDVEIDRSSGPARDRRTLTLDLVRLNDRSEPDAEVLARSATIRLERQDFMLTMRRDDVRALAAVVGQTPDELGARLDQLGLRVAI